MSCEGPGEALPCDPVSVRRWMSRFFVCPKADAIYPIVSAASIVAKV